MNLVFLSITKPVPSPYPKVHQIPFPHPNIDSILPSLPPKQNRICELSLPLSEQETNERTTTAIIHLLFMYPFEQLDSSYFPYPKISNRRLFMFLRQTYCTGSPRARLPLSFDCLNDQVNPLSLLLIHPTDNTTLTNYLSEPSIPNSSTSSTHECILSICSLSLRNRLVLILHPSHHIVLDSPTHCHHCIEQSNRPTPSPSPLH